jgi:mRNA interferase RelE/StbE
MNLLKNKLRVLDETAALVRSLHPNVKRKIKAALKIILEDPEAGKMLKEQLEELRSFRVGTIRIVYRTKKGIVKIIAIGPRKKINEETFQLLKKGK